MTDLSEDWLTVVGDYLKYQINLGYHELVLPASKRLSSDILSLEEIRLDLGDCTRCQLHKNRTNLVFGEGSPNSRLMFIGEGPGEEEDLTGRPFVGAAGRLLDKMINAMGLDRSEVYIANIVKCRPPRNRDPEPEETTTCLPFLKAQIRAIRPEVLVALGRIASRTLLGSKESLGKLRGRFFTWEDIPLMPTYHPSFLLRQDGDRKWKAQAWSDLKMVMVKLGLKASATGE
jgi:uracil-DNA glycosylase